MSRTGIYYWKCDRASAFHGITGDRDLSGMETLLHEALRSHVFDESFTLTALPSQGNHLLWRAETARGRHLVRVEDGPERDDYQVIEARVLDRVRECGVPTPRVLGVDASRSQVPFSWQAMEWVDMPNLQHWHAKGELDLARIMPEVGRAIAHWQSVRVTGFGPFTTQGQVDDPALSGLHASHADYFHTRLDRHLHDLERAAFLSRAEVERIWALIAGHAELLDLPQGVLVHKDLAFWNMLGTGDRIAAFIDFDDAIAGDPLDDLSLLACFHPRAVVDLALAGYRELRPLPQDWEARFALHLLRNMIVKSVIRVGAGYFDRSDDFFLIGSGSTGASFREETRARLLAAMDDLEAAEKGSRVELPLV